MAVTLVEISAWDPVAGAAVVLRACNVDDHRVTRLNGQRWWPVLARAPQRRLDLFDGDFSGQIGIGIGDLEITTTRSATILANAPRYSWGERAVTVWQGPLGGAWGDYVQVFTGLTRPASGSNGRLRIGLRPDDRWLDKPLLAIYAGTGNAEGPAALKGVPKPLAFGAPQFVPGVLINSALNIWQLHGAGSVQAVPVVLDRLARFGGGAFAGNDASYAALAGATIAAGSLRTCLALGLVRFGAPAAVPSFWVEGDNSSAAGWVRRPGAIIKRIAEIAGATAGQINSTSLAALDTWAATLPGGGNLSLYLGDQTTARDIIQQIAASCNAAAGVGFDGKLFVARAGIGSPAFTLAADGSRTPAVADVQLLETSAPFWRQAIAAEPTWRVHNEGEYGVIGVADQISYPDGTLVSTLQPADAGATVGAVAGTNLRDSGGRTLTDGEISNTAQRVAVRQWAFNNNSLNGWTGVTHTGPAPTVTAGSQFATFTANSSDCSLFSPDLLGVDGRVGRYLRLILSATAALSAGMRNVEVYFSTDAYAPIDGSRAKNGDWIPANHPTNGTPFEVLLDMHSLTAGGNAWRDEIVRRVRIDFDGTIPETIRIHEISMVYLGTATVGAPSGTPVGAYADAASIAPAVASAATTAQWPSVTGTGRPADYADVTANNTAFDTARVNGVLAATLTTQSATAASQAATATATLAAIASDTVLSRGEKPAVVLEWEAISDEYADIDAKAAALSVTTERTTWQTARSALDAYLSSLSPPWYDTSADTVIVAATFSGKFRDYYAARNVLLNKLVQVASTLAQWPNVTGTGRPADNATNTAAPNANRVQNSLFETGTNNAEWGTYGDSGVTANPATLSTFGGFPSTVISGSVPNNTARVILSSNRTIPVTAGETIFVGVGANTGATTVVSAQVLFMNASNAYITEIGVGAVAANTNGRSTGFITVPAGATQGVLRVQLSSTSSGSVSATIYQPMVSGAVAGQTLLPAFTRGLNALDGADVTAQNTAAAIAGQAWAATNGAQALVDNRLVAVGSNIVVNSEFTRGIYGFRFAANTGVGPLLTVNGGVNLSADWSGIKNVLWASVATGGANWNAAGEADPFSTRGNWNGGNMTEQRQFGLPVKNGDVVYARCLLARHRCNTRLYLLVFDKDGNYLPSTSTNWAGGRDGGAGGGNPANFDVIGGTHPITHANAATALMMWRMLSTSQADPYIFMAEPAMGVLPAGQTAMPPYQVGNSDPLADQTSLNTAANSNALGGTPAATVASNISTAQTTANSKNRTFTGAATPVGAQAGDYWSIPGEQRLRRWNGTAWEVQLEFIANARTSFVVSLPTTSSFAQLGVGTLGVGPNGTTQVSATITYSPQSGGSGPRSGAIELTIDWRPVPGTGSWTQIGSSQTGSTATRADDLAPGEPGEITIGTVTIVRTLAGPVSVANNEFRVTGRLTGNAMQGTPNNAIISWVP
jgi:hypothetical protein